MVLRKAQLASPTAWNVFRPATLMPQATEGMYSASLAQKLTEPHSLQQDKSHQNADVASRFAPQLSP
jgi:hypothetical protein